VDSGNTVFGGSSNALLVITRLQPITVVFNAAEDHLGEVHAQLRQRRTLALEAFDRSAVTKLVVGFLLTLDNQIDTSTGRPRFVAYSTIKTSLYFQTSSLMRGFW
jgi:multidrug efflux system membrane fusion protein